VNKQCALAAAAAMLCLAALTPSASAITFGAVVANANDSGPGSLRAAMATGISSIGFDATFFSSPRTISLLSPLPFINGDLSIVGPGADLLRVNPDLITAHRATPTDHRSPITLPYALPPTPYRPAPRHQLSLDAIWPIHSWFPSGSSMRNSFMP